ncbi:MAG: DUF6776 family protein [Gammaproteobacteria bacterium]
MHKKPRLVMRREGDDRGRQLFGLAVIIAALALALAYFAGVYWGAPAPVRTASGQGEVARALAAQSAANAKLRTRVAFLEQSLAMSRQSEADTKKAFFKQQASEVALKKKLAFYQGMFPQSGSGLAAVKIAGLQIIPDANAREYRFQIVLVRADATRRKPISGTCAIAITGTRDGKPARLSLAEVSSQNSPIKFKLRYFGNIGGSFRLPAGFEPKKVNVSIRAGDGSSADSSYDWSLFQG